MVWDFCMCTYYVTDVRSMRDCILSDCSYHRYSKGRKKFILIYSV